MVADEADLRRQLDAVHRQMLERDIAFRFHERELQERDRQIEQLRDELNQLRGWAGELEDTVRKLEAQIEEMEAAIGWRAEMRLRSLFRRGDRS